MSKVSIVDLEVRYCVGVPEEERAKPQRLLVTVEMTVDVTSAAITDRIERTINYAELAEDLMKFGEGRSWRLLEKVAANIADMVLARYKPQSVVVEVKKFPIPQARYVSVTLTRMRGR
ncbi:Dihydroneopterin aldolase [Verrucomicrobia bacterium]|nr:Dihydroneopterin aldolase [Verrucomicrobiota bacterium]